MIFRSKPFRSEEWKDAVRSLECCVVCGKWGVEVAHRDEFKGMGQKTHDCWTAPLCSQCHFEIGNGKHMTRDERRKAMADAILDTIAILC